MEQDLESEVVQKYLLNHPKFLDDFVTFFVALERVQFWVKAKKLTGKTELTRDLSKPKSGRLLRSRVKLRNIPTGCSDTGISTSDDKITHGNALKKTRKDDQGAPIPSPDGLFRASVLESHDDRVEEESENIPNLDSREGPFTRANQTGKCSDGGEKFCCTYCNKYFEKGKNLKEHIRIHTKECPYRCRQCGKEFRWRSGYRRHVLGEHPEMWEERMSMTLAQKRAFFTTSNARKRCRRTSSRYPVASRHLTIETEEPKKTDSFNDISEESTLVDGAELSCELCSLCFDTHAQQQNHFRDHEEEAPFQCGQCPEQFSNPREFSEHLGSHKRAPIFSCSVCQDTFLNKEDLREHLKVHPVNLPYQCKFCEQEFRWKGAFFSHIKTKHKDDVTRNSLSFYNSRAQEQASLTVVVNSEVNEKDFNDSNVLEHPPVVSVEKLTSRGDFETVYAVAVDELEQASDKQDATEYCCDICSKVFPDLSELVFHLQIHNSEKPFKCQLCATSFSFTAELTQHLRSCKEAKLHKCRICHHTFSGKSNLKEHYRIHTNEFPYRCKFCSKLFRWRGGLYSHVEKCHYDLCKGRKISALEMRNTSHSVKPLPEKRRSRAVTGKAIPRLGNGYHVPHCSDNDDDIAHSSALEAKPYRCTICDSTFSGKSHLKEHQRIHTMENPYRCKFCQKEFRWRSGLYTHVRRMHKEETNGIKISASDMRNKSVPVELVTFELLSHVDQSQESDECAAGTADITFEVEDDADKHAFSTSQGGLTDNFSSLEPGGSVVAASDDSFHINNNSAENSQGERKSYRTSARVAAVLAGEEPSVETVVAQRTCEIPPGTLMYFEISGNLDPNSNNDRPSDGNPKTIVAVPIHHEEVVDINT